MKNLVCLLIFLLLIVSCKEKPVVKNEEVKEVKSAYISKSDSIQQNTIVNLSFLSFTLGEDVIEAIQKAKSTNSIFNVKKIDFQSLSTYRFKAKMFIGQKTQIVDCKIKTINNIIGNIEVMLNNDIYEKILSLFESKYGKCTYGEWKYKNQKVKLIYEKPQRILYHPQLKKDIYTDYYDFKYILFLYIDYAIEKEIETQETEKRNLEVKLEKKKDSLKIIKEKKEIDTNEKIKVREASQI